MPLRNLTLFTVTALLAACGSCGSSKDAIASARSMSQPRLAKLFRDAQTLSPPAGHGQIFLDTRSSIPDAFNDLDPQSINSDGVMARVHLSGCADDKVLLVVKGIDNSGRKEITLLPGDAKDPVLLWQSD